VRATEAARLAGALHTGSPKTALLPSPSASALGGCCLCSSTTRRLVLSSCTEPQTPAAASPLGAAERRKVAAGNVSAGGKNDGKVDDDGRIGSGTDALPGNVGTPDSNVAVVTKRRPSAATSGGRGGVVEPTPRRAKSAEAADACPAAEHGFPLSAENNAGLDNAAVAPAITATPGDNMAEVSAEAQSGAAARTQAGDISVGSPRTLMGEGSGDAEGKLLLCDSASGLPLLRALRALRRASGAATLEGRGERPGNVCTITAGGRTDTDGGRTATAGGSDCARDGPTVVA